MLKRNIIRTFFQVTAFGIFVFQMHEAIYRYLQYPIVEQRSIADRSMYRLPKLYICQDDQYDNNKGITRLLKIMLIFLNDA